MNDTNHTFVTMLAGCLLLVATPIAFAQAQPVPQKSRIAVRDITATKAVLAQCERDGNANFLQQVLEGSDNQLQDALAQSRKFEVVARQDLEKVLGEQGLQNSGLVNLSDPQAAKLYAQAGARYMATITIDSFQDVTTRATLDVQLGKSHAERRTIQMQGALKIFETTNATLFRSQSLSLNETVLNEFLEGQLQEGRATNQLLGVVSSAFARTTTNSIIDAVFPAKVVGYTQGIVTFNRSKATGVAVGDWWQVFATGRAMIDPDTAENLGFEEFPMGWAQVIETGDTISKAQAYDDVGIHRDALMRCVGAATPAGVNLNSKSTNSASGLGFIGATSAGGSATGAASGETASPARSRTRLAIFVSSRLQGNQSNVMVLEDALVSCLSGSPIEVLAREDVANAVARLANSGANAGTGEPGAFNTDLALSDQSSARAIALNLGAEGLFIASLSSFTKGQETSLNDEKLGIHTKIREWKLTLGYRILDGGSGATLSAGDVVIPYKQTEDSTLRQPDPELDDLLRTGAIQLCQKVELAYSANRVAVGTAQGALVPLQIQVSIADLSVPDIQLVNGAATVGSNKFALEPTAVMLSIDGILTGSAPGSLSVPAGMHRIRLERPMFEPVDRMIVVKPNMPIITIPMKLSPDGLRQWRENALFFEALKEGAVLNQAQADAVEGFAQFLRNSSVKIDTSAVQNLNVGGQSLWGQILPP